MGYNNGYSSTKTTTTVSSPKSSAYDSSKVSAPTSSKTTTAKGKLGDIKRLIMNYLDLCQAIEDAEADLEQLKAKRDEIRAKISQHPQADALGDLLKTSKNPNKR